MIRTVRTWLRTVRAWLGLRAPSLHHDRTRLRRPYVEALEDRLTPAIITVTGTGDGIIVDGLVTLREAIASANNNANENADVVAVGAYGADEIRFSFAGAGPTRSPRPAFFR